MANFCRDRPISLQYVHLYTCNKEENEHRLSENGELVYYTYIAFPLQILNRDSLPGIIVSDQLLVRTQKTTN